MSSEKIGVVGAGLMGAEIALVYALAGHDVLLSDTSEDTLAAALNVLSDNSVAYASATQTAPITQTN